MKPVPDQPGAQPTQPDQTVLQLTPPQQTALNHTGLDKAGLAQVAPGIAGQGHTVLDLANPEKRFCPVCASEAGERFCPVDGTLMVRRVKLDPARLAYAPGHVIDGRYRIVRAIGRGGFGAVFAAVHTGTGQQVALKVLHVDTAHDNQQIIRRFWQEAQITARLRHANTVRVFDVGQTEEGAFYLTMEHLHGRTLDDELAERPGQCLSEAESAAIGIEICKSLQEAHRAGLVHRDLKPANVMLCESGDRGDEAAVAGRWQVKVLDFGIARTVDSSLTGQGSALGTPAFMSPEQCRGRDVDARSDLYSLGILLYRCATGRLPFMDDNPLAVLFHHADTPPPDPRAVGSQQTTQLMAECLLKALQKSPEQRFADAREMQQALQTVLLSDKGLAGPVGLDMAGHRAATMLLDTADQPELVAATASAAVATRRPVTSDAEAEPAAAAPKWPWKAMAGGLGALIVLSVVLALIDNAQSEPEVVAAGPAQIAPMAGSAVPPPVAALPVPPSPVAHESAPAVAPQLPAPTAPAAPKAPPVASAPRTTAPAKARPAPHPSEFAMPADPPVRPPVGPKSAVTVTEKVPEKAPETPVKPVKPAPEKPHEKPMPLD